MLFSLKTLNYSLLWELVYLSLIHIYAKAKTGDGNIVLIHDIHENSVAGLEMALDQLSKEGYQFVTVSDLLKYKGHSEYK